MDKNMEKLLNKLELEEDIRSYFSNAKLSKILCNKVDNKYCFVIDIDKILPVDIYDNFMAKLTDAYSEYNGVIASFKVSDIDSTLINEYYKYILSKYSNVFMLIDLFSNNKLDYIDGVLSIEVDSKAEKSKLETIVPTLEKELLHIGFGKIKVNVLINEENKKKIEEEIQKSLDIKLEPLPETVEVEKKRPPMMKRKKTEDGCILGRHIEGHVEPISNIIDEDSNVIIEATVFDMEVIETRSGYKIATLKLTDYTDSIYAKMFAKEDSEYERILKVKKGKWYRLRGYIQNDDYAHELTFMPVDMEEIEKELPKRIDDEEEKRCELHAHTMMSQMDGVCDEVALVKQAIAFGHPGIAITDHDCCQAFPHVFGEVTGYNKGIKKSLKAKIEELETKFEETKDSEVEKELNKAKEDLNNFKPFKALYGSEIEMSSSTLDVCYNPTDDKVDGNTYVIFDTETTGFNPGLGDSMIEIGGVKIKDGEILDRFDELINPGHHIDEAITAVTEISDDDVKDAKNEEEVTKMFKEWIGDLPLVAHNARFDKNMLDMAYYKYDLGKLENPIIDTLMLSRVINRDLKKHSLKALGKFYGVDTGEADEEDEGTTSNNDIKLDSTAKNSIKDVLVDGDSILVDGYLKMKHMASKSEIANVTIKLYDGEDINKEVDLHPAMNEVSIDYSALDSIKFNIYVGVHHGADVDSENTGYIFVRMLKQINGIKKLSDLNNLGMLEDIVFTNDRKLQDKIDTLCTYKNYIRPLGEDEVGPDDDSRYPFLKFNNKKFVWKYPCSYDNNLQMYENIPSKDYIENTANMYSRGSHITLIAKDAVGLKNLFKIVSYANSNFLERNARIPRRLVDENREGLLIGSACLNGEIFDKALTRSEEDLCEAMKFYDYIEVQPLENYRHLLRGHDINNEEALENAIKKIIRCAKKIDKLVVATGDVHNINPEDLISREIIVNQNVPGKGRHPLARYLRGLSKSNPNNSNIDKLLKHTTYSLSEIDIKVLKYIYALYNIKGIPITLDNLTEIYTVDKNNPLEDKFKGKDFDLRSYISTSLRNLEGAGIILEYKHTVDKRFNTQEVRYTFVENFKYFEKTEIPKMGHIPNQYFRTTKEMLDAFMFLDDDNLAKEIVVTNTNKIVDMVDIIEVVDYPDKPYSPIIEHSQETCRDLVFDKAHSMYGDPLPRLIEERIAQEFYGDKILNLVREKIKIDNPDYDDDKIEEVFTTKLHDVIMTGYDGVVDIMKDKLMREDDSLDEETAKENAKASLGGIIGGGFDVIYLIAQKLVKHSNDDGYLVGSRGSVGSSFVASMMGITECNGLPPHYYCPNCQYSMFENEDGVKFTEEYSSGYDLPNRDCPKCGTLMIHQGNDMPFATFLGFNADKVPDIDLNFSGDNQASAHEYTKVLFGTDNVYRAGTIGTVADKTAVGYALGFYEEEMYNALLIETGSYGLSIPGKDELKKKGVIKPSKRSPEIERIAIGCTGVKRTTGQHPGGIVVVPGYKDVWDFTPFQYPADDPTSAWRTTHFDYHAIDADLLKLDILGHDDPTVLRMLQDMTGIDVTQIDLGDLDTMKIFTGPEVLGVEKDRLRGLSKDGRKYCPTGTLGVPEFGTSFLLGMLEETKPTTFAELIKISGLSHGTDVWLGNARDLCTPDANGEIRVPFKNVIGCRDDIMVNLIQWGMKPAKAFKIMEFVRKGKASKDPATWEGFANEMREANIPDWYIDSCRKIKYMFPKAHATAYVTSAFRIAWFKVHMPIYYYAAYFSIRCEQFDIASMIQGEDAIRRRIDEIEEKIANKKATNKEAEICDTLYSCLEMTARGFRFENVDVMKSDAKTFKVTPDEKGLIIPFSAIDGLGDAVAYSIVKQRNKSPFISIEDLNKRTSISGTILEYMRINHMLGDLPESNQLSLF